jgi:hypothetical protein
LQVAPERIATPFKYRLVNFHRIMLAKHAYAILIWIGIHVALFWCTYAKYANSGDYTMMRRLLGRGFPVARAAAMALNFDSAYVYFNVYC